MSETTRRTEARIAAREQRRQEREAKARLWRRIPLVIVGVLVLLGVGLVVYGTVGQPNVTGVNGPRLQVDQEKVDLGDQHFGTTVRATFKLTNTGDGTLTLNPPQIATVVQGC